MMTPCKNICKIRNDVCIGCNRTLDEIKNWSNFTDEQRNNIMKKTYTKKDFKIDTFRCGGPGGQNQNKRDTGVRITHLETGLVAESREHRTQLQNKKAAFEKLGKLILNYFKSQNQKEYKINTEIVRVYNEKRNSVKNTNGELQFPYDSFFDKPDMLNKLIEEKMLNENN